MPEHGHPQDEPPCGVPTRAPDGSDLTSDWSNFNPAATPRLATPGSPTPLHTDRYRMLAEIARGGMGAIWRATDTALGREVAVKVLQQDFAPGSRAARRFADEARITAQLQHPAIPPVHDCGTLPDGRPFLAMKLIKGRTLDELLRERPDPAAERGRFVAVFEQVCQAVAYAHAHQVIHRDLKPSNVAEASSRRAIELGRKYPRYAAAHVGLGNLLLAKGDLNGAEASYRAAIAIDPGDAAIYFNVGLVYHNRDDLAGAEQWLRKAAEMAPSRAYFREVLDVVVRERARRGE